MYGLDIGGTKAEFAVFDNELNCVHTRRIATPTSDYNRLTQSVRELVDGADDSFGRVESLGVGVPGIRDRDGRSFSVNVPCLNGHDVKSDLAAQLGRTVVAINDGRAFALSEAHGGAGERHDSMVGVILGTGAFGGYCIGGQLQGGRNGVAGEWGHVSIAATVRERHGLPLHRCGCGALGCVECYISGSGMSRIHHHLAGSAPLHPAARERHARRRVLVQARIRHLGRLRRELFRATNPAYRSGHHCRGGRPFADPGTVLAASAGVVGVPVRAD